MRKYFFHLVTLSLLIGSVQIQAGTLSYAAIPATQSDASSGISTENQYTSAIGAGNESGPDRVINGITLHALSGSGDSVTVDNCTVNALSGNLINAGGPAESVHADGTFRDEMTDMTFNDGASDNSQQEIVLDPASLVPGTTYDLRIYIGNSAGEDRQVNLSFVGDGQEAVETGFFNEDDATTSAGGFQDPNQAYYINYQFTWDGESVPGVTVTQKFGQAPFVLYALTNQPVAGNEVAGPTAGDEGMTTGLVTAETDEVGVTSDTFYSDDSLNNNGRWISVKKYGRCWQPTGCPPDWRPYTRGSFRHGDDCGWTWVSDPNEEEWGWAVYHYGRWFRVEGIGCGWAWVPGTVWGPAWVSWRSGQTPECTCVGWAPLPPETPCRIGVGVSRWVDQTCDIGPDFYTFVHVRDFGSDNYERCGCILERRRYVNIVEHTVNITNISFTRVNVNVNINVGGLHVNVYNGGPDFNWCNSEIRRHGGREVAAIHINRFFDPRKIQGGKRSRLDGNVLALLAPKVVPTKKPKFVPKIATTVADSKIGHGWSQIQDPKIKNALRTKIAEQTKNQTPQTTKATLPPDVAAKLAKFRPPTTTLTPGTAGGKFTKKSLDLSKKTASPGGSAVAGQSPSGGKGLHLGRFKPLTGQSPSGSPGGLPAQSASGITKKAGLGTGTGKFKRLGAKSQVGSPGTSPTATTDGFKALPGSKRKNAGNAGNAGKKSKLKTFRPSPKTNRTGATATATPSTLHGGLSGGSGTPAPSSTPVRQQFGKRKRLQTDFAPSSPAPTFTGSSKQQLQNFRHQKLQQSKQSNLGQQQSNQQKFLQQQQQQKLMQQGQLQQQIKPQGIQKQLQPQQPSFQRQRKGPKPTPTPTANPP